MPCEFPLFASLFFSSPALGLQVRCRITESQRLAFATQSKSMSDRLGLSRQASQVRCLLFHLRTTSTSSGRRRAALPPRRAEPRHSVPSPGNPRLTAKDMTATQKRDPKQTHASEGGMKICADHRGRDNLKLRAQASARELRKHSWD